MSGIPAAPGGKGSLLAEIHAAGGGGRVLRSSRERPTAQPLKAPPPPPPPGRQFIEAAMATRRIAIDRDDDDDSGADSWEEAEAEAEAAAAAEAKARREAAAVAAKVKEAAAASFIQSGPAASGMAKQAEAQRMEQQARRNAAEETTRQNAERDKRQAERSAFRQATEDAAREKEETEKARLAAPPAPPVPPVPPAPPAPLALSSPVSLVQSYIARGESPRGADESSPDVTSLFSFPGASDDEDDGEEEESDRDSFAVVSPVQSDDGGRATDGEEDENARERAVLAANYLSHHPEYTEEAHAFAMKALRATVAATTTNGPRHTQHCLESRIEEQGWTVLHQLEQFGTHAVDVDSLEADVLDLARGNFFPPGSGCAMDQSRGRCLHALVLARDASHAPRSIQLRAPSAAAATLVLLVQSLVC